MLPNNLKIILPTIKKPTGSNLAVFPTKFEGRRSKQPRQASSRQIRSLSARGFSRLAPDMACRMRHAPCCVPPKTPCQGSGGPAHSKWVRLVLGFDPKKGRISCWFPFYAAKKEGVLAPKKTLLNGPSTCVVFIQCPFENHTNGILDNM